MYYAKLGEITEEMEFCAIRENEEEKRKFEMVFLKKIL